MATVDPPPTIARIVEVQDPGGGYYVVYVRMPLHLASKFPDKPWGTKIEDVGLAEKDIANFLGYTLVDMENVGGNAADLFWVFQKLDGPEWTTKSQGQESLIPAKYRRLVTTTRTKQEVAPGTQPDSIEGDVVQSVVEQQENTGKATKATTSETISTDGNPLAGEQFAPDGAVLSTSESLILEGDAADKGVNVAQSTVSPTGDGKAVKDTSVAKRRTTEDDIEPGWPKKQVKSKGAPNLTPEKFRSQITTVKTSEQIELQAEDVDDIPEPPNPTGDETVIEHQKVNDWRYEKNVTEEVIVDGEPLSGKLTDTWGINTTEESLVAEGSDVASGFGVKTSRVTAFGNGKAVKEIENYPAVDDPVNSPNVIYTLTEEDTDPLTSVPISTKKSLVAASAAESLAAAMRADGWFTEVRAIDKWHSILISQKLSALILDVTQTWTETSNISLPDILDEVGVIWDPNEDGSSGSSGVDNISTIRTKEYKWSVEAEANASAVVTGRPYTKIRRGYSGPAQVTVVRTFHSGPPASTLTPYNFGEVYGTLTIKGAQKDAVAKSSKNGIGSTSISSSVFNRAHADNSMAIHFFGPVVHNRVSLRNIGSSSAGGSYSASGGSTPGGGYYPTAVANARITGSASLQLPTSGTPLASGATFILGVSPSYYKLGYWVKETRTAKVP